MPEPNKNLNNSLSTTPTLDLLDFLKKNNDNPEIRKELKNRGIGQYSSSKPVEIKSLSPPLLNEANHPSQTILRPELFIDYTSNEIMVVSQRQALITNLTEKNKYLATIGLSFCVGLVFYDKQTKIGALAHVDGMTGKTNLEKFVHEYINTTNSDPKTIDAHLMGGSKGQSEKDINIIEMVLKTNNITLNSVDILNTPKNIILDLSDGELYGVPSTGKGVNNLINKIHIMDYYEMRNSPLTINNYVTKPKQE